MEQTHLFVLVALALGVGCCAWASLAIAREM